MSWLPKNTGVVPSTRSMSQHKTRPRANGVPGTAVPPGFTQWSRVHTVGVRALPRVLVLVLGAASDSETKHIYSILVLQQQRSFVDSSRFLPGDGIRRDIITCSDPPLPPSFFVLFFSYRPSDR